MEADEQQPEVPLSEGLVEHLSGPLRPPEVETAEHGEDDGTEHDVVEVSHDEIRVGDVEIERRRREDDTGQTTEGERDEKADRPEHRSLEGQRPSPHCSDPVEDLHTGRHCDEHGHQREERQQHGAGDVHVVSPDGDRQGCDRDRGVDEGLVSEDRLAAEHREYFRNDAEERQGDDVHLGVPEEPEQVLPEDGATIGRVIDMSVEDAVCRCGEKSSRENRECHQDQDRGDKRVPGEDRHPEHGHSGGAHRDDRRDEVHTTENRAEAGEAESDHPKVSTQTGRERRRGERLVGEPPERCGTLRGEESSNGDQATEVEEPVRECVQTRECHVGSTDLQRHERVREPEKERGGEHEQHDRSVHREQLVVLLLGLNDFQTRGEELSADDESHHATDAEVDERGDQVHVPDDLVVGGGHPLDQDVALVFDRC